MARSEDAQYRRGYAQDRPAAAQAASMAMGRAQSETFMAKGNDTSAREKLAGQEFQWDLREGLEIAICAVEPLKKSSHDLQQTLSGDLLA